MKKYRIYYDYYGDWFHNHSDFDTLEETSIFLFNFLLPQDICIEEYGKSIFRGPINTTVPAARKYLQKQTGRKIDFNRALNEEQLEHMKTSVKKITFDFVWK